MCYYSNIFTLGAFATHTRVSESLFPGRGRASMNFDGWIDQQNFTIRSECFAPLKHSTFITCPNREHVEWFITSQQRDFPFTNTSVPANFHSPSAASQQLKCSTAIVKWKVKSGTTTAQHSPKSLQSSSKPCSSRAHIRIDTSIQTLASSGVNLMQSKLRQGRNPKSDMCKCKTISTHNSIIHYSSAQPTRAVIAWHSKAVLSTQNHSRPKSYLFELQHTKRRVRIS